MTVSATDPPIGFETVDRWDGGVGWIPHPEESLRRASHAVRTREGVWLLDPLDAPGVVDRVDEFGEVVGVTVGSSWHARDAGVFARRYDVPVSIPEWMDRVADRMDASVERYTGTLPGTDFQVRKTTPFPTWQEAILYRERDGTLVIPESMGTGETFLVDDERLGVSIYRRLTPPRAPLADVDPTRILVGHGDGVFQGSRAALRDGLAGARRRAPRAFATHLGTAFRQFFAAVRH
ncbi:MAG: hypothetical protein ACI9PP_000256 [Halobacteriales archaeon]